MLAMVHNVLKFPLATYASWLLGFWFCFGSDHCAYSPIHLLILHNASNILNGIRHLRKLKLKFMDLCLLQRIVLHNRKYCQAKHTLPSSSWQIRGNKKRDWLINFRNLIILLSRQFPS